MEESELAGPILMPCTRRDMMSRRAAYTICSNSFGHHAPCALVVDYMYVGQMHAHFVYILLMKDGASNYLWLRACKTCDGKTADETILEWCTTFGVPKILVSDRGSHFVNALIETLPKLTVSVTVSVTLSA